MNPDTDERQVTTKGTYERPSVNRIGISFIITAIFEQILVCLLYGLLFDFNSDVRNSHDLDDLLLVSIMTILVIVGNFTLMQDLDSITHISQTQVSLEWL